MDSGSDSYCNLCDALTRALCIGSCEGGLDRSASDRLASYTRTILMNQTTLNSCQTRGIRQSSGSVSLCAVIVLPLMPPTSVLIRAGLFSTLFPEETKQTTRSFNHLKLRQRCSTSRADWEPFCFGDTRSLPSTPRTCLLVPLECPLRASGFG